MKSNKWIPALLVSSSFVVMATYATAQMGPGHGAHKKPHKHEMECPMMQPDQVQATATVENVAGGAVIRIRAKQAAEAPRVQELARVIAKHIEEGCPKHAANPPAATPAP